MTILYVAVVLITLFQHGDKITINSGLLTTALVIIDFFIIGYNSGSTIYIQSLSVIAGIWAAVYFIIRYKNSLIDDNKNKERLKALFEFATEGILIADDNGNIIMINPMAEKMFGYDKEELLGNKVEKLIPGRVSKRHVSHRKKFHKTPAPPGSK